MNPALVLVFVFGMGAAFSLGFTLGAYEIVKMSRRGRWVIYDRWHEIALYAPVTFVSCIVMLLIGLFAYFF